MMSIMINNPSSWCTDRKKKQQITASWFYHLIVVWPVSHDYFKNKMNTDRSVLKKNAVIFLTKAANGQQV